MIIRKPYAFLIKNFRKIHIFLLVLCGFIYYKTMQSRSFVDEVLQLGSYDAYSEPITNYTSYFAIFLLIVMIGLFLTLVIVLRHKKKPWKLYVIPVVSYFFLFVVFIMAISFFNSYDSDAGTTGIRAVHDLLFMGSIPQYVVIIILLIRIFGIDLNKFDFKSDQEYLELSSEDREEVEISVNIDKESFKRGYRRFFRNVGYVYQEHKLIVRSIVVILVAFLVGYTYHYFFIEHKSYQQGDIVNSSGYSITIHHSYFTNKDYHGNIISKDSSFVILDLTIQNNVNMRTLNFNRFHIMNGTDNYSQTYRTYADSFQDLGTSYDKLELKNGESKRLILIYKVKKDSDPEDFVLYYQELDDNNPYLRKIKLQVEDLRNIEDAGEVSVGKLLEFDIGDKTQSFSIDEYQLIDTVIYRSRSCTSRDNCGTVSTEKTAKEGNTMLEIFYVSDDFQGKDFVDFSSRYGTINYIDNKGNSRDVPITDAIDRNYYGNYMYVEVPDDIGEASEIRLIYTVRNKKYTYRLK